MMKMILPRSYYNLLEATTENNKWQDFEKALGHFCDEMEYHCLEDVGVIDSEGDIDSIKTERVKCDVCGNLFQSTELIKFFTEWIKKCVVTAIPKANFFKLINATADHFLTFNYTETLEILYHVKNICHIHGKRGGNLIVGHGEAIRSFILNEHGYGEGSDKAMYDIHEAFRKNTSQALTTNISFFENLPNIHKIYSYGFSYSDVDMLYMKEICKKIAKNSIWYFNDYDCALHDIYKEKLIKCGFNGTFATFNISD